MFFNQENHGPRSLCTDCRDNAGLCSSNSYRPGALHVISSQTTRAMGCAFPERPGRDQPSTPMSQGPPAPRVRSRAGKPAGNTEAAEQVRGGFAPCSSLGSYIKQLDPGGDPGS